MSQGLVGSNVPAAASPSLWYSPLRWAILARPLLCGASVLALVLVSAVVLWYAGAAHQFTPRNFGAVQAGSLYRSGQISPRMLAPTFTKYGIDTVIFLSGDNLARDFVRAEIAVCQQMGIERINRPLAGDGTGHVQKYIDALTDVITARRQGKQVLVHCHTGSQRTGAYFAFHRLLIDGWTPAEAKAELLNYGHDPKDNPKLIPYVNQNLPVIAQALADRGLIAEVRHPMPQLTPGR